MHKLKPLYPFRITRLDPNKITLEFSTLGLAVRVENPLTLSRYRFKCRLMLKWVLFSLFFRNLRLLLSS